MSGMLMEALVRRSHRWAICSERLFYSRTLLRLSILPTNWALPLHLCRRLPSRLF